jgi:2-methylcitrate dehydratase PrpD
MALNYDDDLLAGHAGPSAVLATLAVAEKAGCSGRDLLVAQVLANELVGRLVLAAGVPFHRAHRLTFVHSFGAAASAAKLAGLDQTKIAHALAVSLLHFGEVPEPTFFGSEARILAPALAAAFGIEAAQFAASGLRAAKSVPAGGDHLLAGLPQVSGSAPFGDLGRRWLTDTLSFKSQPGSVYWSAVFDCVLDLVRQQPVEPRHVTRVAVATNAAAFDLDRRARCFLAGTNSLGATLPDSIPYNVAVILSDRELTARQFTRERIRDEAVWDLAARVDVESNETLTRKMAERAFLQSREEGDGVTWLLGLPPEGTPFMAFFGARVSIELDDGRSLSRERAVARGAAGQPFDERRIAVEEKFRRETRYTLRKERMEKAIDLALHLEEANAAQVRDLIRCCCSERV